MFLVKRLTSNLKCSVLGMNANMELNWAEGMVGVIPVFETEGQAKKYADGAGVQELEFVEKKDDKNE